MRRSVAGNPGRRDRGARLLGWAAALGLLLAVAGGAWLCRGQARQMHAAVAAAQAALGKVAVVTGPAFADVTVIAAVRPVPGTPWHIVAMVDAPGVLADWRLPDRPIVAILAFLAGGVVTAIFVAARHRRQGRAIAQAGAALRANEERLRETLQLNDRLLGAAQLGIVAYRADGPCVLANEGAARIVGTSVEGLRQQDFRSIPSLRGSGLLDAMETVLKTGEPVELETHYTTQAGRNIDIQCTVARLESGGQPHVLVTAFDVTERKSAEKLRNQLSSIIERTSDFVATASSEGKILYANRTARRLLGMRDDQDPSELSVEKAHPPWAARIILEQAFPTAAAEGVWQGETAFRSHDGDEIPFTQVIMAHKAADGTVELFSTVARDISKRKQAEEEMKARMRILEAGTQSTLDRVLRMTLDEIEARTRSAVAFYHFVAPDQETLTLQAWSTNTVAHMCRAEGKDSHYPVSQAGVWCDAVRFRQPVVHNDYEALAHKRGLPEGHAPVIRELVVPVLRGDRIVAVVGVGNKPTPYEDADVELASRLADISWEMVERKRAEQELSDAQVRLIEINRLQKAVLDGAPYAIISTDVDGLVTSFSSGAERLFGCRADEIVGAENLLVFYSPNELQARAAELSAHPGRPVSTGFAVITAGAESRSVDEREWTLRRRDGGAVPAMVNVTVLRDESGAATGYVCIVQDLTDRRRMDRALEASEERLRQVLQKADCLVWEAKVRLLPDDWQWGFTIHPSGLFYRLFGEKEPESHIGLWYNFAIPERDAMNRRSRAAMEEGLPGYVQEFEVVRDGMSLWMRESVSIKPLDATHFWLVGVATDITERQKAEVALNRSLSLLHATLESTADGILVVDRQDRIVSCNQRFADLFGIPQEMIDARDDRTVLQHLVGLVRDSAPFLDRVHAIYADWEGDSFDTLELADGRIVERHSHAQRLHGQSVGRVWSFRDVTPQRRAEAEQQKLLAELKRSNEELEQFAYVASHDLQEPLRAVASYTQLLARRYGDKLDQDAHDFIGFAVDGATRLQRLINDLLAYSRVGMRGKELSPTSSQAALDVAGRNLALAIEDAGASVEARDLPEVLGDAGQLVQLFQNLVGNGIKFRRPEVAPRVEVSAVRSGNVWRFAVRDNGIGIAEEFHERIFAIFQRLHLHSEYSGTGIGLAVCRRIVERHGGRIWVESEPGAGTTFFFTLPVVP